jgi:hypothetical protein
MPNNADSGEQVSCRTNAAGAAKDKNNFGGSLNAPAMPASADPSIHAGCSAAVAGGYRKARRPGSYGTSNRQVRGSPSRGAGR